MGRSGGGRKEPLPKGFRSLSATQVCFSNVLGQTLPGCWHPQIAGRVEGAPSPLGRGVLSAVSPHCPPELPHTDSPLYRGRQSQDPVSHFLVPLTSTGPPKVKQGEMTTTSTALAVCRLHLDRARHLQGNRNAEVIAWPSAQHTLLKALSTGQQDRGRRETKTL